MLQSNFSVLDGCHNYDYGAILCECAWVLCQFYAT